jgi:sulfate adenylyltransferase subunit 1
VAYRYFATPARKFIIGDAPGHEQYTRNMVTAASSADAAVVLVDATKLKWQDPTLTLLPQTRRHTLLAHLLRVPSIVFAINKLDAVDDPARAYTHIRAALTRFAQEADVTVRALIPISALQGHNVVSARAGWCGYQGPSLLQLLETLEVTPAETQSAFAFPVQWVEKFHDTADTSRGRRIFWGRVAAGTLAPGQSVQVLPGGQTARVAEVLNHVRVPQAVAAGHSAGLILDREVDVSRGDWLLAPEAAEPARTLSATVAWLDDDPLVAGRVYWALHGHRWVKAKVSRIVHRVDIHTLQEAPASQLEANAIGHIELALQEPLATRPYARSRALGGLVLVDTATHKTAGAVLVRAPQAA